MNSLYTFTLSLFLFYIINNQLIYSKRYIPLSLEGRYNVFYGYHKTILKLIIQSILKN